MRLDFLNQFYASLTVLRDKVQGYHYLHNPINNSFKTKGVYFFFYENIFREDGHALKVMRVGKASKDRLGNHRGNIVDGGGSHRGSVFRQHIGKKLINRDDLHHLYPNWGADINHQLNLPEYQHEVTVSQYIRALPFLFVKVSNPENIKLIEHRSIEHLSNANPNSIIDPLINNDWLGCSGDPDAISQSHLWNVHHVHNYQPNNHQRYSELIETLNYEINLFQFH